MIEAEYFYKKENCTKVEAENNEEKVLNWLAGDETSYRSITASWFEHSPLHQAMKKVADKNYKYDHCY